LGELVASSGPDVGSVLSFALRLRKRKSGVSQTQIAKNVAISPNAGGLTTGPPRYAWRAAWCALCVRREKWKNQTKWSTTTRTHEATKEWEVREMSGHESEKFCRYTTWQRMENAILWAGRESVMASKTCSAMMAWPAKTGYQHDT